MLLDLVVLEMILIPNLNIYEMHYFQLFEQMKESINFNPFQSRKAKLLKTSNCC